MKTPGAPSRGNEVMVNGASFGRMRDFASLRLRSYNGSNEQPSDWADKFACSPETHVALYAEQVVERGTVRCPWCTLEHVPAVLWMKHGNAGP